jgi:hypothetical protein
MSDHNAILFGRRIQRLKYYMAVAATPIGADPVMSDMKEFGFTVPGELLNLVSAVSHFDRVRIDRWSSASIQSAAQRLISVHGQFAYTLHTFSFAYRRSLFTSCLIIQPFLQSQLRGGIPYWCQKSHSRSPARHTRGRRSLDELY